MKSPLRYAIAITAAAAAVVAVLPASASVQPLAEAPAGTYVVPFEYTGSTPPAGTKNALQGITGSATAGSYIIVGTSFPNGFVYEGPIDTATTAQGSGSGTWTNMNVPASFGGTTTSIYGVDRVDATWVALVGSYKTAVGASSFYYKGPITSTPDDANFTSFVGQHNGKPADFTILHSVRAGLVVGNLDFAGDKRPAGFAFVYNPETGVQTPIVYPRRSRSLTHTAYGIWYNGGTSYTIAGGQGLPVPRKGARHVTRSLGKATLIDYDSATGKFSNFKTFTFPKGLLPTSSSSPLTHFEGIWGNGAGTYQLPATTTYGKKGAVGAVAVISRIGGATGRFGAPTWSLVSVPGAKGVTTNNSIFDGASIGVAMVNGAVVPWAYAPPAP